MTASMRTAIVLGTGSLIGGAIVSNLRRRGECVTGFSFHESHKPSCMLCDFGGFRAITDAELGPWRPSGSEACSIYFCGIQEVAAARPSDPIATLTMASRGLCNALHVAVRRRAVFLLISGSEVYGRPPEQETPQRETYRGLLDPGGDTSWLGQAMRFAENLTVSASSVYDLSIRIIRVFNAYGEEMAQHSCDLLPRLVRSILAGEYDDIDNHPETGSFCHIADVADGAVRASRCDYRFPINIGSPVFMCRRELVKEICRAARCKLPSDLVLPARPLASKVVPDISLAKQLLDWSPRVELRKGLKFLVSHLRRLRSEAVR